MTTQSDSEPPEPAEQTIECRIIESSDGSTVDMHETDKLRILVFADINVGYIADVALRIDGVPVRDLRPAERQPGDLLIELWAVAMP